MVQQVLAKVNKQAQMQKPIAWGLLQRKGDGCRKKKPLLQRSAVGLARETAPPIVHEVLRSPGQPLNAETRASMEPRFGHDFSRVRVHTDAKAAESAQAVNALAYTVGHNIAFGTGRYDPGTGEGQRLLAHELTHVVQQENVGMHSGRPLMSRYDDPYERAARASEVGKAGLAGPVPIIQRVEIFGPAATGVPESWHDRVHAASSSSDRASLVREAVGLDVVDKTEATRSDATVDASHLEQFSSGRPRINYDDNLNTKRSPIDGRTLTINAGYYLHSSGRHYIVLGRLSLDEDNFYSTRITLNHEFDHIRQHESGSTLTGDESELDAWTSTFIREFLRSYTLGMRGTICYVRTMQVFDPLLNYYTSSDVSDTGRDNSARRIVDYYNNTLRSHPGHSRVFKYWIHRSSRSGAPYPALPQRLNTDLRLGVDPSLNLRETRQFDCADVRAATYPAPPSVEVPGPASASSEEATSPSPRRFGLEIRGGASLGEGEQSAAIALGARYSLRSDRLIILNPIIGAHLLYLPPGGDRTTHIAGAIGEVGLRIQQPLRGIYLDVRTGGYVGLDLPTPSPRVEGGFTGSLGLGYRTERIEIGAEARGLIGSGDTNRVMVMGNLGFLF